MACLDSFIASSPLQLCRLSVKHFKSCRKKHALVFKANFIFEQKCKTEINNWEILHLLPLLLCAGNDAILMSSFRLVQECVSESISACTDVLSLTHYVGLDNVKKQEKIPLPLFRLDACFMQTVACAGKSAACLDGDILQLRLSLQVKRS